MIEETYLVKTDKEGVVYEDAYFNKHNGVVAEADTLEEAKEFCDNYSAEHPEEKVWVEKVTCDTDFDTGTAAMSKPETVYECNKTTKVEEALTEDATSDADSEKAFVDFVKSLDIDGKAYVKTINGKQRYFVDIEKTLDSDEFEKFAEPEIIEDEDEDGHKGRFLDYDEEDFEKAVAEDILDDLPASEDDDPFIPDYTDYEVETDIDNISWDYDSGEAGDWYNPPVYASTEYSGSAYVKVTIEFTKNEKVVTEEVNVEKQHELYKGYDVAAIVEALGGEDEDEALTEATTTSDVKIGDRIRINHLEGENNAYDGKEGVVDHIDDAGQIHGTWGGLAIIPGVDDFEVITDSTETESVEEDTHAKYAKPEGDREASYKNAKAYADKEGKAFIYGYTNHTGKFFALDTPQKVMDATKAATEFKSQYKNAVNVCVAYPEKTEDWTSEPEGQNQPGDAETMAKDLESRLADETTKDAALAESAELTEIKKVSDAKKHYRFYIKEKGKLDFRTFDQYDLTYGEIKQIVREEAEPDDVEQVFVSEILPDGSEIDLEKYTVDKLDYPDFEKSPFDLDWDD